MLVYTEGIVHHLWDPSHWRTPSFFKMQKLHQQPDNGEYNYQRSNIISNF